MATHEFKSWKIMLMVVDSHEIHWTSPMLNTVVMGKFTVYI